MGQGTTTIERGYPTLPAFPDTNYSLSFEAATAVAGSFGVSAKTVTGFTMLSIGVATVVKWKAVQD